MFDRLVPVVLSPSMSLLVNTIQLMAFINNCYGTDAQIIPESSIIKGSALSLRAAWT